MPEVIAKAAAVQGALRDRPLPRLLQQLFRKRFTGYFVVIDPTEDENQIYVREGWPVHVCRPVDTDRLDNLLIEYGLVPADVVAEASEKVTEGQRLGDVLERMGVLDKHRLAQVLKAQVMRKLLRLFFVAEGSYAVYVSGHGFGEGREYGLMRVDPRTVIYPGIRAAYNLPRVTRELSRLNGQRFRLSDLSHNFVTALGIPADDVTVEALRSGWLSLDDLDSVTARPFDVRSVLLAMYYTDSLDREALVPSFSDSGTSGANDSSQSSGSYRISRLSPESGASPEPGETENMELDKTPGVVEPVPLTEPAPALVSTFSPNEETKPVPASAEPADFQPDPPVLQSAPATPASNPSVAASAPSSMPPSTVRPAAPVPVVTAPMTPTDAAQVSTPGNGLGAGKRGAGGFGAPGSLGTRSPNVTAMRPAVKAAPAVGPKSLSGAAIEAVRASIQEMAAKLDSSTHFEILGLGQNASSGEISAAFVRAARQYHPDRLAGTGLQDLQPQAERILARVNEAVMVLQNPGRRAEYMESLSAGTSQTGQNLPTLLEAENLFLKGEVFLKKGDHGKAIEAFGLACQGNPDEPQYRAYLAWSRFDDPRARKEVLVRETLKSMADVLKERPRFARGHYWVGLLWKFLNEPTRAEQSFREAVSCDPSFIEASRELRLIEMRKGKTAPKPDPARGGLMGKFWKK